MNPLIKAEFGLLKKEIVDSYYWLLALAGRAVAAIK